MKSHPGPEVVIVQRRLPHYRLPVFEQLRERLGREGVHLRLLHGDPTPMEARKRDSGQLAWAERCETRYLARDRVCWQNFGPMTKNADLVVITQENKLVYNLLAMTVARPPKRLVPPRITAAITDSSSPCPWSKRPECSRPAKSIPVSPAMVPITVRATSVMRLVSTPLNCAATAFPPVARTRRP